MQTVLFFCFTFDTAFEKQKLLTGTNVNIHQNHCKPFCTIFIIYIHSTQTKSLTQFHHEIYNMKIQL